MNPLGNLEDLGLRHAPQRVVSLVPSVTESLFDLNCGERVRGITNYCIYPADKVRGLPTVGGTKNPDLGKVKAILPDLIIANREENRKEDVEALQAEGFKVWVTNPNTVAETFELLWAIIRLFEVPHMSQVIDMMERVYEYAAQAAIEADSQPKVFVPIWREPKNTEAPHWWMTANRHTYLHDIVRVCGGENAFAERERRYPLAADLGTAPAEPHGERDTRYPRVTSAEIAAHAPEIILLPTEPYPFTEADIATFNAFSEVPAVQHGRVQVVDGSLLTWPGTRVGRALAELPGFLNIFTEA